MPLYKDAEETVNESAPVSPQIGGVPAGLDPSSDAAQNALSEYGRSAGYMGKSVLTGAAMGIQASQGSTNPLTAFVQGAAAGLQAPAQAYAAKRDQIQSALDATPFAITHPEVAGAGKPYAELGGMPTAIGLKILQQAYIDSNKAIKESEARKSEMNEASRIKLLEIGIKGKDPLSVKDRIELSDKFLGLPPVKDFTLAKSAYDTIINSEPGIGDKAAVIKFAQMLNPSVRVNEQTMDSLDASGTFDKFTSDAWRKASTGAILGPTERSKLIKEAGKIYAQKRNDYHSAVDRITEEAVDNGFNPRDIVIDKPLEVESIQLKTGEVVQAQVVGKTADGKKQYRMIAGTGVKSNE